MTTTLTTKAAILGWIEDLNDNSMKTTLNASACLHLRIPLDFFLTHFPQGYVKTDKEGN